MNSFIKIILVVLSIFVLSNCTKPIDIKIPQAKTKIAVFSQIIPNQVIMVGVTKSFTSLTDLATVTSADTNNFGVLVDRALVTLKHNNFVDTLKKITKGIYGSTNTTFLVGETYELNVYDSISGERVKSTAKVIPFVDDSLNVSVTKNITDTSFYIQCIINDNQSTEDYYYMNFSISGKSNFISEPSNFYNNLSSTNTMYLLSDINEINGKVSADYSSVITTDTNTMVRNDSVTVVVSSISKEYFQFLTAYKKGNSLFTQLFGEPINYPSNVENGLGVFTMHLPKFYFLDLKNY